MTIDGTEATNVLEFSSINESIDVSDNEVVATVSVDLKGIDKNKGVSGAYLQATGVIVEWTGEESDETVYTTYSIDGGRFSKAVAFPNVPVISATREDGTLTTGNNRKLYEFTVSVPGSQSDHVYLGQAAFTATLSSGITLTNAVLRRGDSSAALAVTSPQTVTSGTAKFAFTTPERIRRGSSETYSLYANVAGVASDKSVTIELATDGEPGTAAAKAGRELSTVKGDSNFVWSPNGLDKDGATSSNADWFGGWAVFDDSDVSDWTKTGN